MDNLQINPDVLSAVVGKANALPKGINTASMEKINKSAEEFESMFMAQMLAPMWAGVGDGTDDGFGGGFAEETYRGMMVNEFGSLLSKSGGVGIAAMVRSELLKLQEKI